MVAVYFNKVMTSIFGSRNERLIKTYRKRVELINSLESTVRKLSDAELKQRAAELGAKLRKKETTDLEVLPEAFAIMRESMDRQIGLRNAFNPDTKFDTNTLPTQQLRDATPSPSGAD